jgi:hypothetical protein
MAKKVIEMYLARSKDTNWELAQELGLSETASENFAYALYEVKLGVELGTETGDTKIVAVDGRTLG